MLRRVVLSAIRVAAAVFLILFAFILFLRLTTNPSGIEPRAVVVEEADPVRLEAHVRFLVDGCFPRNHRSIAQLDAAADYIARHFEQAGGRVERQTYEAQGRAYQNVRALFGPDSGPRLVVGAHYDAYGELPGADDNASGTAMLLELASGLGQRPPEGAVELVAWTLEEPPYFAGPLMGSAIHARDLRSRNVDVIGVISLEMVGYYTDELTWGTLLGHAVSSAGGNSLLIAGRREDVPLIKTIKGAANAASALEFQAYAGPTLGMTDLSDNRNAWAEGFAAVMITDTAFLRNARYHTSADRPETLDYEKMAEGTRGVLAAIRELTTGAS